MSPIIIADLTLGSATASTQLDCLELLFFLMFVRYILSLEDHLAWYEYYVANIEASSWSLLPFIGRLLAARRRKRFMRDLLETGNRFAFGERTLELSPSGVREFSSDFDFATAWEDIAHVAVTQKHLFIAHPSMNAHVIPLKYFENEELRDSFVSCALSYTPSLPSSVTLNHAWFSPNEVKSNG